MKNKRLLMGILAILVALPYAELETRGGGGRGGGGRGIGGGGRGFGGGGRGFGGGGRGFSSGGVAVGRGLGGGSRGFVGARTAGGARGVGSLARTAGFQRGQVGGPRGVAGRNAVGRTPTIGAHREPGMSGTQRAGMGQIRQGNLAGPRAGAGLSGQRRPGGPTIGAHRNAGGARLGRDGAGQRRPGGPTIGAHRNPGANRVLGNRANRGNLARAKGFNRNYHNYNHNYYRNFNNFWWGGGLGLGIGLGLGGLAWWGARNYWYSPWSWWGYPFAGFGYGYGYSPWTFDDIQPLVIYKESQPVVYYTQETQSSADVPVQQTQIPVNEQLYNDQIQKIQTGLDQQANAIISLADQIAELEDVVYKGAYQPSTQEIPTITSNASGALQQDIVEQAQAIKALAFKADEVQKKLNVNLISIDTAEMDQAIAKMTDNENTLQGLDQILESARATSKSLNQVAELVLRLQHQVGIVPEGLPTE